MRKIVAGALVLVAADGYNPTLIHSGSRDVARPFYYPK
jgi:hypothetical protein